MINHRITPPSFFLIVAITAASLASASGAVLLHFESSTLPSSVFTEWNSDAAQSDSNLASTAISFGSGLRNWSTQTTNNFGPNRWRVDGFTDGRPNEAQAISANDYFSFTINPLGGSTVDVTSIDLRMSTQTTDQSPNQFFFSTATAPSIVLGEFTNTAATNGAAVSYSVPLSGLTGITSETEIRLYGYNGDFETRYVNIAEGDFIVNGTVIPEPESFALILSGALFSVAIYRRNQRRS